VSVSRLSPARGGAEASERVWGPGTAGTVERKLDSVWGFGGRASGQGSAETEGCDGGFFKKKANCHL